MWVGDLPTYSIGLAGGEKGRACIIEGYHEEGWREEEWQGIRLQKKGGLDSQRSQTYLEEISHLGH